MMADRRRRSPEGSNKLRKAPPSQYGVPPSPTGMRSDAEVIYLSSSSSSSYEYVDISRSFPPNRSGIKTFFTAPSERRLRKRRSSRALRHSNSSSESVGDLAYGHGYLRRPKLRRVRSRKGKEIDRERYSERERERDRYTERYSERYSDREQEKKKSGIGRATTDAEILAVGAGLAKLAREQNKLDLKSGRGGKQSFGTKEFGRTSEGMSRGLGPSKISHGSDTVDEDGWESASDAESESSVDSRLAFGAESSGGWFGRKIYKPQSRKSSVVDPRLFGPANSLHGVVTQPVGFGEVTWNSSSDFGQYDQRGSYTQGRAESVASGSLPPMQNVYPYATEDSTKFDAARSSVVSGPEPYVPSRPGPVPIQHPQPITPVSQSIYEPVYGTKSETGTGILKKTKKPSGGRSKSLAEAALFGVAGAAVGAAIASDRKDDRKERRRDDERDARQDGRISSISKRKDSERKDVKEVKDDRKHRRDSPDREDRKEKRGEKDRAKDSPEDRSDKRREKRRDDGREETRDERRERRREERRSERGDDRYDDQRKERSDDRYDSRRTKSEAGVTPSTVDPFQYQVDNDAFETPSNGTLAGHGRVHSVPTVVTVEREPDFTRRRSSSIKDQPVSSRSETGRKDYAEWDERDAPLHNAEEIYEKERHFTAPIAAAAVTAAIAAEGYRESRSERRRDERRGDRRSDYDDSDPKTREENSNRDYEDYDSRPRDKEPKRGSRDYDDYDRKSRSKESKRSREPERDPIQEEADRAYREIVMARKIASQVIRSRSPSPNRSVVDKYEAKEEEEDPIRIVTPPGMEDHKKGPYDAPNADFQLDYVIDHTKELRTFSLPSGSRDRSNSDTPYLKKDPEADRPRPFLNLVLPTPSPSPQPEKQVARSEPARQSEPQGEPKATTASDVAIGPRGDVVPSSSTASTVSKGVTWGENETKHFEVESPSEHRDEFVSSPEIRARDAPVEQSKTRDRGEVVEQPKPSSGSKRGGWGAIAAGIIGAGAGAAAASSETSKSSKSSKIKENEKKEDAPYEYRGVVVEPESPPRSQRQRSPPTTGPKPTASQTSQSSHIPGAFDDDLDFTATVAAGLQDTGFDPNIVINDPKFRRRDSPPGSNEPIYRAPYAETVSDLGSAMRDAPPTRDGQGFVIGEVATTPRDWPTVSPTEEDTPTKLSKKDQKKRDKALKRQSVDSTAVEEPSTSRDIVEEPEPYFEPKLSKKEQKKRDKEARRQDSQADDVKPYDEPSVVAEIVAEPESYFEEPKKKSKKSKKGSSYDDEVEDSPLDTRKFSVPVDAFDDLRKSEDEWSEKKSKRKSKRDSERYESPSRSVVSDTASPLERTSSLSKKSKDKSKRKSDQYETDPTEFSLPPSTPSETSRDGEFEESRRTRKSSHKDSTDRDEFRSVVSADASRYDDDEPRKSKRKSKSRDDFDDTRSVASAPAGDEYEDSKRSKKKDKDKDKRGSGFFGLFGSKSEVGASTREESPKRVKDDSEEVRKKSKKSKRSSMPDASSLYGDLSSQSISDLSRVTSNGNGNGNGTYHDDEDRDSRSESRKKSRSREESTSSKKDSFLAKAGTLGAGVGLAGAAVAIAAQRHQQSNADNAHESNETAEQTRWRGSSRSRQLEEILDPEITQRQFRPSIDPQYGDLLPLPPSDPVSPNIEPLDDLPGLPDSRSNTPEAERLQQERAMASIRRSFQDSPVKSPSQSAIPLKFAIKGNRSNPSSPAAVRASPLQSPAATSQDSLQFPRTRPRPTSWDSTKEYKPLYLVESNRRGSNVQHQESEEPLPALPPSEGSRSSSILDSSDEATFEDAEQYPEDVQVRFAEPLSINTGLAKPSAELLDSQQSTPKATVFQYLDADQTDEGLKSTHDSPSLPAHRSVSPLSEEHHDSHIKTRAEIAAGAALVSSIGYFASAPVQRPTDKSFLEELPSHAEIQRQPSPVDPVTKNRSSYLLQSSPLSRQTEEDVSEVREEESPTSRQRPVKDALHSIRERDQDDVFEQSREMQPAVEEERERALDALSGSTHDRLATEAVEETLPELRPDRSATEATNDAELADEFVLRKSKKDKKNDKKRGKGPFRSSTQDEISQVESGRKPIESTSTPIEVVSAEEFSLPKSKKDKKKGKEVSRSSTQDVFAFQEPEPSRELSGEPLTSAAVDPVEELSMPSSKKDKKKKGKGLSRSSTQDVFNFQEPEPSPEITGEPSASVTVDPIEEFSTPKSKKDKKKDKKKGKSSMAWEPEEEPASQITEESFNPREVAPEEISAQDDSAPAETKKSKKDKKIRESIATWEHEDESRSAPDEEPTHESKRHVLERIAAPAALGALGVAAYEELELSDEPTTSLQHTETEKAPESVEHKRFNVFDFQEKDEEETSVAQQEQPAVILDSKDEVQPSEDIRDIFPGKESEQLDNSAFDDDSTSTSKKNIKKKGKSISSWEPDTEQVTPPPSLEEPEATSEFSLPGLKKSKKKGKKSLSWTLEETLPSESVPEPTDLPASQDDTREVEQIPTGDGFDSFVVSGSKKSKKKGRKSQSWTPEESLPTESVQESIEPPVDAIEDPQPPIDVKADEKPVDRDLGELTTPKSEIVEPESKSSGHEADFSARIQKENPQPDMEKSLESDLVVTSSKPEPKNFEDFTVSSSTKGRNKSRKSQRSEEEPQIENQPEILVDKSLEPEVLAPVAEKLSAEPTPTEGPGSWETPISAPWATANEEAPGAPSTGYFPSAAVLHSPQKVQSSEGSKDRSYFPSVAALLPVAAAGAAILAADQLEKKSDNEPLPESSSFQDPESEKFHQPAESDSARAVPDGLKARYRDDQLSLARQLQEEFGAGSKKIKKDKKKRQSLPVTPDRDFSRSRDPTESLEDHHRARSLSMRPSPATEGSNIRPMSEDRKNVYSEDQLELARQLKAEFEGGNKKSKKDKKKRQSLSRISTQDDSFLDKPVEEPDSIEAVPVEDVTAREPPQSVRDGFEAGYQEDQLSLARQLQAEFGSGSKKSKKDKKRRSTSQTPLQEPEQADYFGDTSRAPVEEPRDLETADTPGFSGIDNPTARDGLAVGYNEEQLELARQLKEEFSSGSSKSKKGKKEKKRQSLLRNTTEDDFSSDFTKDGSESHDINPQNVEAAESGEPTNAESDDEFVFTTKKSKKDKKGKKRESLARSATDDIISETISKELDEPRNTDIQRDAIERGSREPASAEPDDEFAFATKKSKKGKKRESLNPAPTEPEVSFEDRTKEIDEPANIQDVQQLATEVYPNEPIAEPEDEFAFTTKKSKKDKKGKKRESVTPAPVQPDVASENVSKDINEPANFEEAEPSAAEVGPSEPSAADNLEAEYGLTRKKSKKDKKGKKRDSSLPASTEPENLSETIAKSVEEPGNIDDVQEPSTEANPIDQVAESPENVERTALNSMPSDPVAEYPEDEFGLASKKSKKDKKHDSVLRGATDEASSSDNFGNAVEALHNTRELPSEEAWPIEEPVPNPAEDDWSAPAKKSKKEKKKRQSLATQDSWDQPAPEPESLPFPESKEASAAVAATSAAAEASNQLADDVGVSTETSKKDKEKSQSLLQSSTFDEGAEPQPEETTLPRELANRDIGDGTTAVTPGLEDVQDDGFEFSTKKSKKVKMKRQITREMSFPDTTSVEAEQPSSTIQTQPITEDLGKDVETPISESRTQDSGLNARDTFLDDNVFDDQPARAIEENPEVQFENFAFTTKKSKKDKKRNNSSVPESDEPSRVSTPVDPTQDNPSAMSEPPKEREPVLENAEIVDQQPLGREVNDSTLAESTTQEALEDPAEEEWGSFSTKKSKKDEKKRKSGLSTPTEEPALQQTEATTSNEPLAVEKSEEISGQVTDPVDEEWGSFTLKKSKKDKKNRKSGLSTPADDTSLQAEPIFQDPVSVEKAAPDQVQDPAEEEWGSFTTKKSKKDKKKSKSGLSTPMEETIPEPETTSRDLADVIQPALEEEREDPLDDEWSSFTTKKSQKGKKRSVSGLPTPLEENLNEPPTTLEREIVEPAAPYHQPQDTIPEPEYISQKEISAAEEEVTSQQEEPVEEEWGLFTTKKSKKDKKKNKSGLSTPLETLPESESSTCQRDLPLDEQPKNQLEELLAGGVFTTTKSKKDKKNKPGFSLPLENDGLPEAPLQDTQRIMEGSEPQIQASVTEDPLVEELRVEEAPAQDPSVNPESSSHRGSYEEETPQMKDPADEEWGSVSTKKSKKGKKNKSDSSTLLEETLQPEPVAQEDQIQDDRTPQQAEDAGEQEWDSFTTKKSRKDKKKRKSGLYTPVEEPVLPTEPEQSSQIERAVVDEASLEALPAGLDNSQSSPLFTHPDSETTNDVVESAGIDQETEDRAFDFVTKRSKKDKKKRKSGLSTPIEETLPVVESEKSSQAQQTEFDERELQPLPTDPESSREIPQSGDNAQTTANDDFEFSTKRSKKDKKKRKSGLSTPLEETLPPAEPEQSSRELVFEEPAAQLQSMEHESFEKALDESPNPTFEATDRGFEFTKKSKKDKKGKTASRLNSESGVSTLPPIEIAPEERAPPVPERFTQSPGPIKNDGSIEQAIAEPDLASKAQRETTVDAHVGEQDEIPFGVGRKPSKKDKRKRQATVADIPAGPGDSKPSLTSWADEVEEAEIEREAPVIEDIAQDESLSHIASTTEDAPTDDFSRPTKKGKKGKKSSSGLTREASMDESYRPPITEDTSENKSEHSEFPVLAATGAALAGAALLSRQSGEESSPPTSKTEPASSKTEADIQAPTRKLSKKEKRKQNIDRRVPSDDPFDDPALWESAEPRSFEESKDANDDTRSDGFWSAPSRDEEILAEEPPQAQEPPHDGPIDLFATSRSQEPAYGRVPEDLHVQSNTTRDFPTEQQRTDSPDKYTKSSSGKDNKKDKARDTPLDSRAIAQSIQAPPELPRTLVDEPFVEKPGFQQRPSMPPNDYVEESPVDRNISFQDDDFQPRSSLRHSYHAASPLPVVREESPTQMESERFEHRSYSHGTDDFNRDSAFVTDSPIPPQRPFANDHIRDSGVHLRDSSPAERAAASVSNSDDAIARLSWPSVDEKTETVDLHRSQRPKVETVRHEKDARTAEIHRPHHEQDDRDLQRQYTTEDSRPKHHDGPREREESHVGLQRTKTIHRSHSPREERSSHHGQDRDTLPSQRHEEDSQTDLQRTKTIHRSQKPDSIVKQRLQRFQSPDLPRSQTPKSEKYGDLNTSQRSKAEKPRSVSDNSAATAAAIGGATLGFAAARQASREGRPDSAQSQRSVSNINRLRTPDPKILRPESVASNRSSGTPPLRRSDRKSGDLRSLSQRSNLDLAKEAELAAITAGAVAASTTATPANPQANEGRVRAKEMADVYDGFGEGRMGSPRSPTRPHSMRRRQSMQVLDLEQRLEQLAAENRALADAKDQADRALQTTQHASSVLVERDAELDSLKRTLAWLQNEVTRLTEVNDGLTSANITLGNQHNDRYNALESQHAQASRELQEVRDSHNNLSAGMEGIIRNEVQTTVQEKDQEIAELRAQLEAAKEQIRAMQRQILESKANDGEFLTIRDEDYFDNACQQLCQHVQQWVLRFSKFSDMRACRLTSEINNDKIIDRLDNAILDGSDVDSYLADRVKRRDVFMSMTMTMVWEFVFTRYLFGMDREQRQKLKSLEKLLSEVGPASAVHQWRATTLTLLSKREGFVQQREQDTLAVVNAVLETLTEILPPPSHLEQQIQEQLTRVMKAAVDLSIEMRTQRAEYMMLPPLQPEYDANGDLASKVSFNAALMNERSGDIVSNEELEAQKAVVRIVLFPLVVKKGDDSGEGDEEIVVCPAQVLVAKPKKQVRIFSNESQANHSRMSMQSSMPADYGEGSVI